MITTGEARACHHVIRRFPCEKTKREKEGLQSSQEISRSLQNRSWRWRGCQLKPFSRVSSPRVAAVGNVSSTLWTYCSDYKHKRLPVPWGNQLPLSNTLQPRQAAIFAESYVASNSAKHTTHRQVQKCYSNTSFISSMPLCIMESRGKEAQRHETEKERGELKVLGIKLSSLMGFKAITRYSSYILLNR